MRLLQGSIAMAAILAGMAGTALAQGDVYIPVTSTPPVIDGILANDPGWEGSSRIDLDCSGVAPVNYVRLCRTADASPKIYVGFRMESTSVPPGSFDRIILALQPMTPDDGTAAAHAWRIHIDPFSQRSDAGTYSPGGVQFWMNSAGWKNATGTDPDLMLTSHWLQKANMKVTCEANGKWGFEMALTVNPDPATAQQNIGVYVPSQGRFKLYLDVIKIEGTSLANQHAWPKNVFVSPTLTGGTPLPDTWGNASYTASASTSVQLTYDKIGTTIPPSLKNYSIAPYTPVSDPDCPSIVDAEHSGQFGPSNTIYCKPRNRMPMTAELRTTFSIADWGVPAPSDWFTVTYPPTVAPPMPQLVNPTDWATVAPGIMKTMTLQWPMSYKQSCQMGSVLDKSIKVDLEGKGDTKFTETPVIRSVASGLSSEFRH
ncbi:MAG: hypothetical protein JO332_00505, partial [Planctomycetaceae bacterium]|nr:hypothetical protein [Planctomycetaceae bacterium]